VSSPSISQALLLRLGSCGLLAVVLSASCGAGDETGDPYEVAYRAQGCGNGLREGTESCDGADLGGETCESLTLSAMPSGTLRCAESCVFDVRACRTDGAPDAGGTGGAG
jgi:hypothetical protein